MVLICKSFSVEILSLFCSCEANHTYRWGNLHQVAVVVEKKKSAIRQKSRVTHATVFSVARTSAHKNLILGFQSS